MKSMVVLCDRGSQSTNKLVKCVFSHVLSLCKIKKKKALWKFCNVEFTFYERPVLFLLFCHV